MAKRQRPNDAIAAQTYKVGDTVTRNGKRYRVVRRPRRMKAR